MCAPVAPLLGLGLSIAGSVAGFVGQQNQTNQYNAAARQNAINANVAATNAYTDEQRKYGYDMRQIQQEGYQATMKGRQAIGTTKASVGASGFDIGSLSVSDIISNQEQQMAMNLDNIRTKQDDREAALRSNNNSIKAQAEGRINSMPFKAGPSPLGLMINIADAGFNFAKDSKYI